MSADVDVTLALTPDAPDRFADDMQRAGFSLRVMRASSLGVRGRLSEEVYRKCPGKRIHYDGRTLGAAPVVC